ncbi:hypothetical protein EDD36DRAFT_417014 [Exophiala viscosa]|uniref:C2H2-type domain-containing protein n=1 Tax=Exophiala viscosa TaxID=2486360 RepID=A0AAN6E094_9EURO|nr:hypothetical protein EDD36DRAFT_417014 [Exophiala viscosa]
MANKRKHDGDDDERPRPAPGIDTDICNVFVNDQGREDALTRLAWPNGLAIRAKRVILVKCDPQIINRLVDDCMMQSADTLTVPTSSALVVPRLGQEMNTTGEEEVDGVKDEGEVVLADNLLHDDVLQDPAQDNVLPEKILPDTALPGTALLDNAHANKALLATDLQDNALPDGVLPSNVLHDNSLPDSVFSGNILHDNPLPNDTDGDDAFSSVGYNGDGIVTPHLNRELNVIANTNHAHANGDDDLVVTSERPAKPIEISNEKVTIGGDNRLQAANNPRPATRSAAKSMLDALIASTNPNKIKVEESDDEEEEAVDDNELDETTEQQAKGPLPGSFHGAYNLPADDMGNIDSISEDIVAKIDVGDFFGKRGKERFDNSGFTGTLTFNNSGLVVLCLHCGRMFSSLSSVSKHRKLVHKGCDSKPMKQCYSKRLAFRVPKSHIETDRRFRWEESECLRRYIAELKGLEDEM